MKKILIVLVLLLSLPFFSAKVMRVYAVTFCGQVTRQAFISNECASAVPAQNCAVDTYPDTYSCFLDDQNRCVYWYKWQGCSYQSTNPPSCHYDQNYVLLDCSDSSGGGGGGGFNWFSCPSGQAKSCGSPSEALAQNKYACTNRAYCDNHFSPELIGGACAYQDNGDPYKWDCQWNCSCCPTGSYRSCTQGSQYTVDVRIELPLDEAGIAAKVSCVQWHGHDDIFVSNDCLPIGQNCNNHDDQWQDWQLTCIHNDCGCATPPTPTPPAPKKSARTSKPRGTIFAAAT